MNKFLTFLALSCLSLLISSTCFSESIDTTPPIKTIGIGEFEIHILSEGDRPGKIEVLLNPDPENLTKYLPEGKYTSTVNAFLIITPDKIAPDMPRIQHIRPAFDRPVFGQRRAGGQDEQSYDNH